MPSLDLYTDAELVASSLAGDREAFGQIVTRYQRLLCSVAYSSTGQLSHSEDLAQETFIEAWRRLADLREPEKLRSWLCGILRFKVSRLRRADGKEPARLAETLDNASEVAARDEPAADLAVQKEEQAILWSALERVPETYREPLILYYREHQSVEHVAASLDLSEDAVKQRLARGRKILQEQVLAFVEGALARSTPGRLFTVAVLAALPEIARPAKAAALGVTAAKGGMIAKTSTLGATLGSISGFTSAAMTLRVLLDQARTARERRAVAAVTLQLFAAAILFLGALWTIRSVAVRQSGFPLGCVLAANAAVVIFSICWTWMLLTKQRRLRELRTDERHNHPELFQAPEHKAASPAGEYKSRWTFLGLPLVHIRFALPDAGAGPVVAWIAAGDRAVGALAAWGGCVAAPFSVGAVSVGIFSIGTVSLGIVSLGTASVGVLAIGCAAIGTRAFAWLSALGWQTAQGGGLSVARQAAEGAVAWAAHANDAIARAVFSAPHGEDLRTGVFVVLAVVSIVPIACYGSAVRRRFRAKR